MEGIDQSLILPLTGSGFQTSRQRFYVLTRIAGATLPNGNMVREALRVTDNEVAGSFKHLLPEAHQTAPVHAELSEVLGDFCFDT